MLGYGIKETTIELNKQKTIIELNKQETIIRI